MSYSLGLTDLVKATNRLSNLEFVGRVVDISDPLSLGRVRVMISTLFDGLSTSDLPWINMDQSVGFYVRPQLDDSVSVKFKGSIYEGFYQSMHVNLTDVSRLITSNLGESFVFNFDKTTMSGKYDGSSFRINSKSTTQEFDLDYSDGELELKCGTSLTGLDIKYSNNQLTVNGLAVIPNASGGVFCSIPVCPLTGLPHQGNSAIIGV